MQAETMKDLVERLVRIRRLRDERCAGAAARAHEILSAAHHAQEVAAGETAERLAEASARLREAVEHEAEEAARLRQARGEGRAERRAALDASMAEQHEQLQLSHHYWAEAGRGA